MEPGLYPNLSRLEYDAMTARLNRSRLKHIGRSPAHFRHALDAEDKDTPARAFGRLAHLAILEPERLDDAVVVWTGGRRSGKEWAAFQEEAGAKEIVTDADLTRAAEIAAAVRTHPVAGQYVTGGRSEVTALWTNEEPDRDALPGWRFDCKARLDYVAEAAGCLVDVKTCRDASPEAFGRDVWNMQYHVQAAWYRDGHAAAAGCAPLPFVLLAVESEAPHVVQVYRVPDWILDAGRDTYRAMLGTLAWSKKHRTWPGYSEGELDLSLPRWAIQPPDETDLADTGIVFGGA